MATIILLSGTGAQNLHKQRTRVWKKEARALLRLQGGADLQSAASLSYWSCRSGCWLRACAVFWRTLLQPSTLLSPGWHSDCIFKRPSH